MATPLRRAFCAAEGKEIRLEKASAVFYPPIRFISPAMRRLRRFAGAKFSAITSIKSTQNAIRALTNAISTIYAARCGVCCMRSGTRPLEVVWQMPIKAPRRMDCSGEKDSFRNRGFICAFARTSIICTACSYGHQVFMRSADMEEASCCCPGRAQSASVFVFEAFCQFRSC